jgi:hypothetical protein
MEVPLFRPSTVMSRACPELPFVPLEWPFVAKGILKCGSIESLDIYNTQKMPMAKGMQRVLELDQGTDVFE